MRSSIIPKRDLENDALLENQVCIDYIHSFIFIFGNNTASPRNYCAISYAHACFLERCFPLFSAEESSLASHSCVLLTIACRRGRARHVYRQGRILCIGIRFPSQDFLFERSLSPAPRQTPTGSSQDLRSWYGKGGVL